jgi:hypothetical protein
VKVNLAARLVIWVVASALGFFTHSSAAYAGYIPRDTRINVGMIKDEPDDHHSYVRDANLKIVGSAGEYTDDIAMDFKGGSVDIVMQQCFSGGFVDHIAGLNKPHTFASAAAWNEASQNGVKPKEGTITYLENFTRSWRQQADTNPNAGMLSNFQTAISGNGAIKKDRFSPPSPKDNPVEHPQYESPDPPPPMPTPNDKRTLTPPKGGGKEYAILVAWDKPNNADATKDNSRSTSRV